MTHLTRPLAVAVMLLAGCGSAIERPETALDAYVAAVEAGQWGRAYRLLDEGARGGMSAVEYRDFCEANDALVRAQAREMSAALDRQPARVVARLPVDPLRAVALEHIDGAWFLAEGVPLETGAGTPVMSMRQLAAVLHSDEVARLLHLLSEDMRTRYFAEIDAIVDALGEASASSLSVYGDMASVEVGEITIHLVREDGAWHVSNVEQPYAYEDDSYYEDW